MNSVGSFAVSNPSFPLTGPRAPSGPEGDKYFYIPPIFPIRPPPGTTPASPLGSFQLSGSGDHISVSLIDFFNVDTGILTIPPVVSASGLHFEITQLQFNLITNPPVNVEIWSVFAIVVSADGTTFTKFSIAENSSSNGGWTIGNLTPILVQPNEQVYVSMYFGIDIGQPDGTATMTNISYDGNLFTS